MLNGHIINRHIYYHLEVRKRNVVSSRVQQARRRAEPVVTQTDLAARLQVLGVTIDQSGISKIESGQRPVLDFEVLALAKALKVAVGWLLGETNEDAIPKGVD
jgi:transcriptional regulator with XRE-family HTH domain